MNLQARYLNRYAARSHALHTIHPCVLGSQHGFHETIILNLIVPAPCEYGDTLVIRLDLQTSKGA